MSRKKVNIKMQLHQRVDDLLRIGAKKEKESLGREHYNPNRSEGIHSIKTADTYRSVINVFAEYCKTCGVRDMEQIDREVVRGFVTQREHMSAWTISKDLSAINKVLDTHYTPSEFGFGKRESNRVVHNRRLLTANNTADAERNRDALWFVHSTGCRRSSICTVTAEQAIRDADGMVIGFHFREKGGRERNALILPTERETMTTFVDLRIEERGSACRLIDSCDSRCNPHFERGGYARDMYAAMLEAKRGGVDIYAGYRSVFINEQHYQKAVEHPRYRSTSVRGYDTHICAELSQQLGHNRISVVINSYLDI